MAPGRWWMEAANGHRLGIVPRQCEGQYSPNSLVHQRAASLILLSTLRPARRAQSMRVAPLGTAQSRGAVSRQRIFSEGLSVPVPHPCSDCRDTIWGKPRGRASWPTLSASGACSAPACGYPYTLSAAPLGRGRFPTDQGASDYDSAAGLLSTTTLPRVMSTTPRTAYLVHWYPSKTVEKPSATIGKSRKA